MLLPGENYSEQLMFTVESYKERWVDRRAANLYGEALEALEAASNVAKADKKQVDQFKGLDEKLDLALDIFDTGRKAMRFSKVAAPLILADGPLPFGDAIFVAALALDLGVAAYNLVNRDE